MDSNESKILSIRAAAREAGTPYSIARCRILGLNSGTAGGSLKYSEEEEDMFADFVLASADLGVPLTKQLLVNMVINYEGAKG